MRTPTMVLAFLIALPLPAQTLTHVQLDTVNMTPALLSALAPLAPDTAASFCASFKRYKYNVFVDSLRPATTAANPDCAPREAVVLVRPLCAFSVSEFLFLRVRALYVLILCRPNGMGLPLGTLPRPGDRIADGLNP